jgi:hypothetical protein
VNHYFGALVLTLIKKVTMEIISYINISSRFLRRIFFLFIILISSLLVIIFCVRNLENSSYNPFSTPKINITRYNAPHQALNNQPSINNKHLSPFIHQPSSKSSILRALLVFYPNDQELLFQPEFRWLYRSWTEMMINESSLWRTDLIVYASEYVSFFTNLDCVYNEIRLNSEEKPKCRVFPYTRIKDRASKHEPSSKYQIIDSQNSKLIYQHLRTYGYIDSINTVFEYDKSYFMYDYILRTDMDCFLTYNFAFYVPYNNTLLVGRGGYSTAFNNHRLKRIAHDMNWKYADKNSLGSTW